ncbi:pirin family protein [Lacihabitans lacunae]|uniref:Pirin family protein n=1 Tax=Lacihabitans lacunae TaxID=1028214 RepID=A0ABV7YV80_9BACT
MKTIFFSNTDRGHANHGWLNSYHTFSFGGYHNPSKMNFGALRVLNDDTVNAGMGFSKHPHDNMEIVSIPLEGGLEHQDSMGNKTLIKKGEVQIMSAGTGVFHSEKNESGKAPVKFLQIWVFPDKKNIEPRYDQKIFDLAARKNKFQTVVSPLETTDEGVKINQNAWFSLVDLANENTLTYNLKDKNNGVYVFVLEGELEIDGQKLSKRDGLGITETEAVTITSSQDAEVLLMEIPMSF